MHTSRPRSRSTCFPGKLARSSVYIVAILADGLGRLVVKEGKEMKLYRVEIVTFGQRSVDGCLWMSRW